MKKIIILLMVLCLWGCDQQKEVIEEKTDKELYEELMKDIKTVMPSAIYNELNIKQLYTKVDDTILVENAQENPTLRLDFTYKDNQLVQYVSKEYGFVEALQDNKIIEDEAKVLAKLFAQTFLNEECSFEKTTDLSGYETGGYITLEDQNHNIYLIDLNKNMLIHYIDHNFL